jgi:hypothetical protein
VAEQIQFSADGSIHSRDGQVLNRGVQHPNALSDAQKAAVGIQTRDGNLTSWNSHSGNAQTTPKVSSVQLLQPTGRVAIAGTSVTPEVAATLAETAPDLVTRVRGADGKDEYLTVDPAVKAAEAAKAADDARAEEISREDLNRHPVPEIEAAHQHFVGEVSNQNQIALLVYGHRGEAPPAELLKTIADEMHVPLHEAIDKVNAISMATQAQFTVLARSMNLDADKAADWLRTNRRDTAMAAAQAHGLRRDLMAWKPLLEQYRASTGDGVKH